VWLVYGATCDADDSCLSLSHLASARDARDVDTAMEDDRSQSHDVEQEAFDLAVADRVNHAMAGLPATDRKAIELAYFDGYTYREVAKLLDTPEGMIKNRIRAGLKRMRADLIDL
jgi:RNA polymerase sigma-70 factor (ECF subfamily)